MAQKTMQTDYWWLDAKKNEDLEKAIKDNTALPPSPKEVKLPKIELPQILKKKQNQQLKSLL